MSSAKRYALVRGWGGGRSEGVSKSSFEADVLVYAFQRGCTGQSASSLRSSPLSLKYVFASRVYLDLQEPFCF